MPPVSIAALQEDAALGQSPIALIHYHQNPVSPVSIATAVVKGVTQLVGMVIAMEVKLWSKILFLWKAKESPSLHHPVTPQEIANHMG